MDAIQSGKYRFLGRLLMICVITAVIQIVYMVGRGATESIWGDQKFTEIAYRNGDDIVNLEKTLYFYAEDSLQDSVTNNEVWNEIMYLYYRLMHQNVAFVAVCLVALLNPPWLYVWCSGFWGSYILALIAHMSYPCAPPRLLPGSGITDLFAESGVNLYPKPNWYSNRYAAIPSLHFGWSFYIGSTLVYFAITQYREVKRIWQRTGLLFVFLFGIFHPTMMLITIVATGNHFFMDAVLGFLTIGIPFGIAFMIWKKNGKAVRPKDHSHMKLPSINLESQHMSSESRFVEIEIVPAC